MDSDLLTTGEVAKLCGVTPDAVLKWIKKGDLPATRTPGGHYRVARSTCTTLGLGSPSSADTGVGEHHDPGRARPDEPGVGPRCWEYFGHDGRPRQTCLNCVVYQARAEHCYKLATLGEESGHGRRFCGEDDCQDCSFYRAGHGLATTVLVITRDDALTHRLTKQVDDTKVALRFARSGYESSSIVGACRPAVVVMDSDLPDVLDGGLPESMLRDDRIPGAKVVVACRGGDEVAVRELAMPTIEAPFDGRQLEELTKHRTTTTGAAPRDVAGA